MIFRRLVHDPALGVEEILDVCLFTVLTDDMMVTILSCERLVDLNDVRMTQAHQSAILKLRLVLLVRD